MLMVKRYQKNNERKFESDKFLKKNFGEKISVIVFMIFEFLYSLGSRLYIFDILSWKYMIGVVYIFFLKDF